MARPALSRPGRSPKSVGTFPPPLSEPGVPISGTGLSSGIMRLGHGFPATASAWVSRVGGTQLAPVRRTGRCVVRPVYALATATARVVPFAYACDDVRHSVNMNDSPDRIDSEEAAIGRPTPTARRLVEASVSLNTRRAYAGAPASAGRLARRPDAPRCDPGRLPRRAARRRARFLERLDGGRRGVLPCEARRAAHARRRADGPGARRVPADRRRSGTRTGAAVRGFRPGGRARHLPSTASARARRRVRPGRP